MPARSASWQLTRYLGTAGRGRRPPARLSHLTREMHASLSPRARAARSPPIYPLICAVDVRGLAPKCYTARTQRTFSAARAST